MYNRNQESIGMFREGEGYHQP